MTKSMEEIIMSFEGTDQGGVDTDHNCPECDHLCLCEVGGH